MTQPITKVGHSLPLDIIDHGHSPRPARPAATAVLLRDGSEGLETLMIRRNTRTAFGGMWAFPGGVIESQDVPAGGSRDPLPAAKAAAARETLEEVGLTVEADSLVWISHWLPPAESPARFSTWFFAAEVPAGVVVEIDGGEVHEHRWISPESALAARDAGEIQLVTPTFVTLMNLAHCSTVAAALDVEGPVHYATSLGTSSTGVKVCMYPGDVAYEGGDVDAPGPRHRLVMDDELGWSWEDTR